MFNKTKINSKIKNTNKTINNKIIKNKKIYNHKNKNHTIKGKNQYTTLTYTKEQKTTVIQNRHNENKNIYNIHIQQSFKNYHLNKHTNQKERKYIYTTYQIPPYFFYKTYIVTFNKYNTKRRKPKRTKISYYTTNNRLYLQLCGDIETNPGPTRNILINFPPEYKQRDRTYFTPNTIQLRPEYKTISTKFKPHLNNTHPQHNTLQHIHRFLARFIRNNSNTPKPILLYVLIITISPDPDRCNLFLFQPSPHINNLLTQLNNLQNPLENTLTEIHPYNKFMQDYKNITNLPTTIHKELYNHIENSNPQPP